MFDEAEERPGAARKARDVMGFSLIVVDSTTPLREVAQRLEESGQVGACVVDDGVLVGVIGEAELIYRERSVHLPSFFTILDAVEDAAPEDGTKRFTDPHGYSDACAADVMSGEPVTVAPDLPAADVAALMVQYGLAMVPVVDGNGLLGVVTRRSLLRAAYGLDAL